MIFDRKPNQLLISQEKLENRQNIIANSNFLFNL